ncbi:selenoprotein S [Periophthalmus magnuspinnatus]|uniref:selenoprotein S n=1 Tax=Periophthalmus magnuspinnatus TaxID=409849 RepID=UPI00145A3E3F|nr:selenoprotein S [Periophthalmus magnuspinnatus]
MGDNTELPPVEQHQRPLRNQDLSAVTDLVQEIFSQYGWYLLAATALFYLLIQYIVKKSQSVRRTHSSAPPTHQDVLLVAKRQEALEAARMRMQEELDAKAAIFKEKQKQQEEEKRRQKIELWDNMKEGKSCKGNTSQSTEDSSTTVIKRKTDKKPLRSSDYNPLSGDGGGACAWRPGRRGPSAGG